MSRYYPVHLDLSGNLCVVIGGGPVATRKVSGLLEAGAAVRVVSPAFSPELQAVADAGAIEIVTDYYDIRFLEGAFLVFAATNDRTVNARITQDAQAQGMLVNAADAPEAGDFVTPSVVRRGELLLSVSTGGNTPSLAAKISRELETRFGPEYAAYVELLGTMRLYMKENVAAPERRASNARLLAAEPELLALLREGQTDAALERAKALTMSGY